METLRHTIILFITFFLADVCFAQPDYSYQRDNVGGQETVTVFDHEGRNLGYYEKGLDGRINFYRRDSYLQLYRQLHPQPYPEPYPEPYPQPYRQTYGFGQKDYTQLDRMRENLSLIIDRQLRNDAANLQAQREANEREKEENLLNETPIYDQQGKVQYTTHWNPLLQRYDVFNAKHALIGGYILNPQTNEWDFLTY